MLNGWDRRLSGLDRIGENGGKNGFFICSAGRDYKATTTIILTITYLILKKR